MSRTVHVVAVPGSLREESKTRVACRRALAGVLAVAGGFPTEALSHLRGVVLGLRATVHTNQVIVPSAGSAISGDEFAAPELAERVAELGVELARAIDADAVATPVTDRDDPTSALS